jgi:hypothetical protein
MSHSLRGRLARLEKQDPKPVRSGDFLLLLARADGDLDKLGAEERERVEGFLELARAAMARPDPLEEAKRRCLEELDRQASKPAPAAEGDAS